MELGADVSTWFVLMYTCAYHYHQKSSIIYIHTFYVLLLTEALSVDY